jgi:hypothetical protein
VLRLETSDADRQNSSQTAVPRRADEFAGLKA